jgi:hypothetical protein
LYLAAGIAVVGAWSLWRGQKRQRPISSLRLWRDLMPGQTARRSRRLDPLWLLVLLAGVLAAAALAGPRWVRAVPGRLDVRWSIRTVPGTAHAEAWVEARAEDGELRINGVGQKVSGPSLAKGMPVPVMPDAQGKVRLELQTAQGRAAAMFEPRTFGLIERSTPEAPMDPLLRRVFAVQSAARPGLSIHPCVLLVSAPSISPEDLAGADLVIALPTAVLPGLVPGASTQRTASASPASPNGWTPQPAPGSGVTGLAAWPSMVPLNDVHVTAARRVVADGAWQPAAVLPVGAQEVLPWVLMRQPPAAAGAAPLWVWLASMPTTETDWFKSPGFVVYFMHLLEQSLGRFDEWIAHAEPLAPGDLPIQLAPWLGAAAIGMIVIAVGWLLVRTR